jgi:hypothetical protein
MITLITAVAAILYLLRAERLRRIFHPIRLRVRSTVPQPAPILVPERMYPETSLQPSENSNMLPVIQPIRVESSTVSEGNVIRVVVPPSNVPSLVEVVIPNRRTGIAVTVLAGLGMVLLYLLAWQRRPKR